MSKDRSSEVPTLLMTGHLLQLYVLHRQKGLSEVDSLAKAREELQFIYLECQHVQESELLQAKKK
jgi:hypothetical protein